MALTLTNPFAAGTDLHNKWETDGTKTLTKAQAALAKQADAAYARQDQTWFDQLPLADLTTLWGLVSGINMFAGIGAWDDEVYDALFAYGYFGTN